MRSYGYQALRAYIGSYDSLTALYRSIVDVASAHLWDGERKEYYSIPDKVYKGYPFFWKNFLTTHVSNMHLTRLK